MGTNVSTSFSLYSSCKFVYVCRADAFSDGYIIGIVIAFAVLIVAGAVAALLVKRRRRKSQIRAALFSGADDEQAEM
jgi:hypothetical protein